MANFRWIPWNRNKVIQRATLDDVEHVVNQAAPPYPQRIREGKWIAIGATPGGRLLQVIYLLERDRTVFVIHVRELTEREKRRWRRRKR